MSPTPWELTRESFLSESEVSALIQFLRRAAGSDVSLEVDRIIAETLLFTGIRNTEFCRLTLGDLDLAANQPALRVSEKPGEVRSVYLPGELATLLSRYLREIRPARLLAGMDPTDPAQPLFVNERGKPYERTALYRRVVKILSAAGLAERASVQLLRHTYGYLAYKRTGGNLLFVQQQLGHAHPMVTAIYAQFVSFDPLQLANAVAGGPPSAEAASSAGALP